MNINQFSKKLRKFLLRKLPQISFIPSYSLSLHTDPERLCDDLTNVVEKIIKWYVDYASDFRHCDYDEEHAYYSIDEVPEIEEIIRKYLWMTEEEISQLAAEKQEEAYKNKKFRTLFGKG